MQFIEKCAVNVMAKKRDKKRKLTEAELIEIAKKQKVLRNINGCPVLPEHKTLQLRENDGNES